LLRGSEERVRQIRQELEIILKSGAFRGSKRSQLFLRYVVDRALEGCDLIKERSIGIEVFGRKSTYDPGDDSVVRVTARDVRSRLSQFNLANKDRPVCIELPPGSYVPEFHPPEAGSPAAEVHQFPYAHLAEMEPAKADPARRKWWRLAMLCALLLGMALWVAGRHQMLARPTPLERFWAPLVNEREPVLICAPTPVTYDFRAPVRQRFGTMPPESSPLQVRPIIFPPDGVVYGREIATLTDAFVGEGDAQAIAQFAALLARMGKPFELKTGSHTSLGDLRRTPAILIGAYTNEWSGHVVGGLPFVFSRDPTYSLRENGGAKRQWIPAKGAQEQDLDDYALITRVWDPTTRQPVVLAGGIMNYGTEAAGEFLTNPAYVAEAFRNVSSNWSNQNIQIALHVTVIGKVPGAPRVIALHVW
jgi:hypothetical protein